MNNVIWSSVIDLKDWEEQLKDMRPDLQTEEEKLEAAKGYNDDYYKHIVQEWDIPVSGLMAERIFTYDDGEKFGYTEHIGNNLADMFKIKDALVAEWADDDGIVGKFEHNGYTEVVRYYVQEQGSWMPVKDYAYAA